MDIREYVKELYDALPKSNFNDQELVVILEIDNQDYGYGSHSYSGLGVDRDGKLFYCFSSGCSCSGECGVSEPHGHDTTTKKFEVDGGAFDLDAIDGESVNFDAIQVDFSDY